MNNNDLSPEMLAQLAALDAMPDDQIDTSDIRELTDEEWNDPCRRRPSYNAKPVAYPIQARVAHWFQHCEGCAEPEEAINRVLLDHVKEQMRKRYA